MEQLQYLINTNSVIDYLGKKLSHAGMIFMNDVIDSSSIVSVITKIEVLGFNAPQQYYKLLEDFMNDSIVLELSASIVSECIKIRKIYKTKLPDAIIAATAVANNLILITHNSKDFNIISGIQIIDPHLK